MALIEKFNEIESKFLDVERRMSDPEIISNQEKYQLLVQEHSRLKDIVDTYRSYQEITQSLDDTHTLLNDPDMKLIAEEEIEILSEKKKALEEKLTIYLMPTDPNDHRNAILEIRSGTGGNEAALFASDLFRMYSRFAEQQKWKIEVLSENLTNLGGIKEISILISGIDVYRRLKFESGTHRVQRVPDTESSGRIHTSAVTVAIMPEATEVDINIDPKDLRIDTFRSSGAGGQHVNKTDSAIRITHIPSGVVVSCQEERSQFQNKERAMNMLRTKLYEQTLQSHAQEYAQNRKLQVGTGDRSQKIRTYNFPQNRITDHRINLTLYNMDKVLEGALIPLTDALIKAYYIDEMSK
jgi:peptide chain release factor 1